MAKAPALLYVTPVVPSWTGNGLAMRGAAVLDALLEHYRVWVLVTTLYPPIGGTVERALARRCEAVRVRPGGMVVSEPRRREALLRQLRARRSPVLDFARVPFSVVHVFRLAALPAARPYAERGQLHLDLDEVEATTHQWLAQLQPDRIYVSSELERARLGSQSVDHVRVLPNALRPIEPLPPRAGSEPVTFLFVGTMGYEPNADAVTWFCEEALPHLRRLSERPFRVVVVGSGAQEALGALPKPPELEVVGPVRDVTPYYADADAVIAPLRAGGGTRIKILEAFAFGRPVVSTTVGAEGLDVRDGAHLLLGDDPETFARQCLRLIADGALARRLTVNGRALYESAHTGRALANVVAPEPSPGCARARAAAGSPPPT
jgi:glycosyltransferase involved in cell wall biosynthesis